MSLEVKVSCNIPIDCGIGEHLAIWLLPFGIFGLIPIAFGQRDSLRDEVEK